MHDSHLTLSGKHGLRAYQGVHGLRLPCRPMLLSFHITNEHASYQQQTGKNHSVCRTGHGSQSPDPTGEETDGMSETILPCDFKTAGQIHDAELNRLLINPLITVRQRSYSLYHVNSIMQSSFF